MLSPTSLARTGRYPETIDGAGLDASGQQAWRVERANAAALGEAIREAVQRARGQGVGAFAPDTGILQVPSVPLDDLRELFATVLRVPYSKADEAPGLPEYGPLSLEEWSRAEATLALHVARADSMLPPGAGGGPQYARGQWYVDGESYTTAELFLTLRLGNIGNLDQQLATDLNTMAQNTQLARELLAVLADTKRRSQLREGETVALSGVLEDMRTRRAEHKAQALADYDAVKDFGNFVEAAGLTLQDAIDIGTRIEGADSYLAKVARQALDKQNTTSDEYDKAIAELEALMTAPFTAKDDFGTFVEAAGLTVPAVIELGLQFRGAGSYLAKVGNAALADAVTTSSDYDGAMKELQALFDSINTENDVKKVRVDSMQNERMTMLVGLSAYLSSTLVQNKTVERNL